jgi:cytochrome c oxidase subunit IV
MTETVLAAADTPPVPDVSPIGHDQPDSRQYVWIALILGAVTAVEVGLYYTPLSGLPLVAILMGLAVIKFGMVAAYFMHLRFDSRLLRRVFLAGVILAGFLYSLVLITMDVLVG